MGPRELGPYHQWSISATIDIEQQAAVCRGIAQSNGSSLLGG